MLFLSAYSINMKTLAVCAGLMALLLGCANNNNTNIDPGPEKPATAGNEPPPAIVFNIIKKWPHDSRYFTEGFEFHKGQLFESSGGNEDESPYPSEMGQVDLNTGKVTTRVKLDRTKHFGEGITVFGNTLYMLTWTSQVGFRYDINTFKPLGQFALPSKEGWGLTHDSSSLIMSDGSSTLYYLDPANLQVKNRLNVYDKSGPVSNINELEYVNGFIWANKWLSPYILKIDPSTGNIVGRLDLTEIENEISRQYNDTHGLNGIAYNAQTGTFFITGKNWPFIYELKVQ